MAITLGEYRSLDGIALAGRIAGGEIKRREAFGAARDWLERVNPHLNAMCIDYADRFCDDPPQTARGAAFSGVPFLLKNQGAQASGLLQTYGSRLFEQYRPDYTSTLFERFVSAGLVPLGRSNTPEFSLTPFTDPDLHGASKNPWAMDRITGGSSGGAAAAVAAGIVPLAHATDGGGSIRQPASCCGVLGLKPSRGRAPFGPRLGEGWNGLSTQMVVSRSVRDSAVALQAIGGLDTGDPYTAPALAPDAYRPGGSDRRPLRILASLHLGQSEPAAETCREAVLTAARLCEALGHSVEYVDVALEFETLRQIIHTIYASHTASLIQTRLDERAGAAGLEDVEPTARVLFEHGRRLTAESYIQAITALHLLGRRHAQMMAGFDAWLTYTMSKPPPPAEDFQTPITAIDQYTDAIFAMMPVTAFQNVTGQPAMSVPLHWTAQGLPIGCHFTAAYGREDILFRLAYELEQAAPWQHHYERLWQRLE